MNQEAYNNLITETFCENAIRTVMLIDDEHIPYSKLVNYVKDGNIIQAETIDKLTQASELQRFFEEKELICDISDGFTNFNADKARKSDLIILDYFLENNEPRKTVEILEQLAKNDHLNLVVLHSNQDLDISWLQVSANLIGGISSDFDSIIANNEHALEFWNNATEDGTEIPETWTALIKQSDLENYILEKKPSKATIRELINLIGTDNRQHRCEVYNCLCSYVLNKHKDNILNNEKTTLDVNGSLKDKWLKIGNVFICFSSKSENNTGELVYSALKESLVNWKPNYFRLISSEIQNKLENKGIPISNFNEQQYYTQAGWLWKILSSSEPLKIQELLDKNWKNISEKLIHDGHLFKFSQNVLNCFNDFPQNTGEKACTDTQINYACTHTSDSISINAERVVHELNKSLSMKAVTSSYITTGMILKLETQDKLDKWYVCVSPACDCVPSQNNTTMFKRLAPQFKPIKLLELTNIAQKKALSRATEGKCIFIDDNTTLQVGSSPNIEYILSHNNTDGLEEFTYKASFIEVNGDVLSTPCSTLIAYAQLKEEYAAKLQAMASHHVGRIGVDFVDYGEVELNQDKSTV